MAGGACWTAYLLYAGAPAVMKVRAPRTLAFTAAALCSLAGVNVLLRAIFVALKVPYMGY